MKLILIRGIPGTGKTSVAKLIEAKLSNAEYIRVDKFKLDAMDNGADLEKAKQIAYQKTLEKLDSIYDKDYVIIEELIYEKFFLNELCKLMKKNRSVVYWFRLMRPLDELLKVEAKRKRKIKNTEEDLIKLKKDIESCKIKNEIWIKNDDLDITAKRILDIVV